MSCREHPGRTKITNVSFVHRGFTHKLFTRMTPWSNQSSPGVVIPITSSALIENID